MWFEDKGVVPQYLSGVKIKFLFVGASRACSLKVNHNACSLHLATHFQTQTSHMDMFYMVY